MSEAASASNGLLSDLEGLESRNVCVILTPWRMLTPTAFAINTGDDGILGK